MDPWFFHCYVDNVIVHTIKENDIEVIGRIYEEHVDPFDNNNLVFHNNYGSILPNDSRYFKIIYIRTYCPYILMKM